MAREKNRCPFILRKKIKLHCFALSLVQDALSQGVICCGWLHVFSFMKKTNLIKFGCTIAMECLDQNNSYKLIVQINTVQVSKPIHKEEEVGTSPSNAEREMVGFICLHHLQVYEHAD